MLLSWGVLSAGTWQEVVQSDDGALVWVDLTLVGALVLQADCRDWKERVCPSGDFFEMIQVEGFNLHKKRTLLTPECWHCLICM